MDFDEWMKNMGLDLTKQPKAAEASLMVMEALYDLIIDTRKNNE